MIKVVHANDKLSMDGRNPSSVAHLLGDWIPRLAESGVSCSVCTLRDPDPGADYLEARGIRVERMGHGRFSPRNLRAISKFLRDEEADIAHMHGFGASNFGRLVARRLKVTGVVHEHAALMRVPRYQIFADRLLSGLTDAGIAVSENVREFMIEQRSIPADRITIIENGVDLNLFHPADAEAAAAVRVELAIPKDHAVVGSVGRLRAEKGTEFLIRAIPRVLRSARATTFLIAGDGPLRGTLEALAANLGVETRVRFLGFRSDIPRLLAGLDILVLPSLTEGSPLSLLEGMAVGCPIVATPVGGVRQVASEGKSVLFVPPGDADAIARQILELIADPSLARALSREARRVAMGHSVEASVARLVEFYRALLAREGLRGVRHSLQSRPAPPESAQRTEEAVRQ